jgi:uncharacterized protein (TIGR04255 family)
MTDRTGILQNSPLVYVLASIRFAPWPLLAKKIDEIHDELRKIAPLIQRIQVESIGPSGQATEGAVQSIWMLMSSDRSYGFHLAPDQFLVYSKKYGRYAGFEETLRNGLNVLLKHMRFMDVTSMGVRYVDHIKMSEQEKFEDYIDPSLLPKAFDGFDRVGGIVTGTYKAGGSELRVRCIAQPEALSVPEDIIGVLAMAQEPGRPLQLNKLNNNEILLDMDAINKFQAPERMDTPPTVLSQLKDLHTVANAFFRHQDVCTDYAFKKWKGEEG